MSTNTKENLLFICNVGLQRSPTGAALFNGSDVYEAKYAGIDPYATVRVSQYLIDWADKIFVMSEREDRHVSFLHEYFDVSGKEIYDLDISDVYFRGQPELKEMLRHRLSRYVEVPESE